jgi:purine-binding chemotaxis protein CheW
MSETGLRGADSEPDGVNQDTALAPGIPSQVVVFALGDQLYALPLTAVERVVRMVAITPLPQAPAIVLGVINVRGQVMPVLNLRRRFRLPERDLVLTDQLIISHTVARTVVLVVDEVAGVREYSAQQVIAACDIVPGIEYTEGVVKLDDGLVLIHNLDKFLSLEEEAAIDQALEGV